MYDWYYSPEKNQGTLQNLRVDRYYISVLAAFDENGKIKPLRLKLADGRKCDIDEILETRDAPALRDGRQSTRYVCRIGESETIINLFYENPRWFIERPAP